MNHVKPYVFKLGNILAKSMPENSNPFDIGVSHCKFESLFNPREQVRHAVDFQI
jgi:hypothetical protein